MRSAQLITEVTNPAILAALPFQTFHQPGREGVEIYRLYDTADTGANGPAAAIVRYKPGAQVKRDIHPGYELIFVLDGELINDTGHHCSGTLEVCPPNSSHALSTEKGCTLLVVWEQPVRLADAQAAPPASQNIEQMADKCGPYCAC